MKNPTQTKESIEALKRVNTIGRTKAHQVDPSQKKPNYFARRAVVAGIGLAGVAATVGLLQSGESGAEDRPPVTTVVVAEQGDTVWGLQREEANRSGVDPNVDIREHIDEAVRMNDGSSIDVGQPVVLVDIPDK